MSKLTLIAALAATGLLAACGGGGTPAPPPNQPPGFGNASFDISYPENSTATVITLAINDEAAASVTLTLGGADRARFTIANGRDLNFITPPDFENPQDAGADNIYNVTVTATDALGRSSSVDITVRVTNTTGSTRFVDPVFAVTASMGTVAVTAPSGVVPVTFIGPAGDPMAARPLVVLGSADTGFGQALASDFAQRGYLVALTGTQAPADLVALAQAFQGGAQAGMGIDSNAVAIAAPGDLAFADALRAHAAGSGLTAFAFTPGSVSAQAAASEFYAGMALGTR